MTGACWMHLFVGVERQQRGCITWYNHSGRVFCFSCTISAWEMLPVLDSERGEKDEEEEDSVTLRLGLRGGEGRVWQHGSS